MRAILKYKKNFSLDCRWHLIKLRLLHTHTCTVHAFIHICRKKLIDFHGGQAIEGGNDTKKHQPYSVAGFFHSTKSRITR